MSETETAETVSAALNLLIYRNLCKITLCPIISKGFSTLHTRIDLKINEPIAVPTEFQKSTVSVDGNDIVRQTVDWPAGILYDRLSIP